MAERLGVSVPSAEYVAVINGETLAEERRRDFAVGKLSAGKLYRNHRSMQL